MNINDIIGKGKDFEPPFKQQYGYIHDCKGHTLCQIIRPSGNVTLSSDYLADHICELLNRKHNKQDNHERQINP